MKQQGHSKGLGLVVVIAVVASAIGVGSYLYSTYNADLIARNAIKDIERTARIQTNDIGKLLENKAIDVRNNLRLISESNRVQQGNIEAVAPIFSASQDSTKDFTDSYFWIDKDGKLLWDSSFSNQGVYEQYAGADRSDRAYYLVPKQTHAFHITNIMQSIDGVTRFYFSFPILSNDGSGTFKGVIVASANLQDVGRFLKSQVSSETPDIGLLSKEGIILYAEDKEKIGFDFFGDKFQGTIPEGIKSEFNSAIEKSLASSTSGSVNLPYGVDSGTLAYTPISADGNEFAVLYMVAPYTFADETLLLLDNQRVFTILFILALAGVALATAIAVVKWNRGLAALVEKKTSELVAKTNELEFSNEALRAKSRELQSALEAIEESNRLLENANEQLKIHDRLQKEFVNVAAHELRTPIQPLLGAAELLESQLEKNNEIKVTRPEIEMILRNAKRLERLSSDILEVARIESNSIKLDKQKFSLSYLIVDAIKDAKAQSYYSPDKVKIAYTPDDIFVFGDREKITQVITNLLTNAIKFTREGVISIETQADAKRGFATVSVKDTGEGINPEVESKLFDKFVTKSDKGTGIGLYISKKILEAHGGSISGTNNPEGQGAVFTFKLPLAKEIESAEE